MSRTLVPPQCVGNRNTVERRLIVVDGNRNSRNGRPSSGGMHVPGLCIECNRRAGRWDEGYRDLHQALGPPYLADRPFLLPHPVHRPQGTPVRLGSAARSMLAASLALDPQIRGRCPELPTQLMSDEPFELPAEFELRLAVAYGRRARITGAIMGFDLFGARRSRPGGKSTPIANMTVAQAHFAPVAWQLAYRDAGEICDRQGWARIDEWTQVEPFEYFPLNSQCSSLPMVAEVRDPRAFGDRWTEMYANEHCFIVQCDDIAPHVPPKPD